MDGKATFSCSHVGYHRAGHRREKPQEAGCLRLLTLTLTNVAPWDFGTARNFRAAGEGQAGPRVTPPWNSALCLLLEQFRPPQ